MKTARIGLRAIRPSDVDAVRALQTTAWSTLAAATHTPEQLQAHIDLIEDKTYETALLTNNLTLAWGEEDGRLLGTAGWCDVPGTPSAARIRKVFVHPDAAGLGLGRMLVNAAETEARLQGRTRFTVRSNANAEAFYAALGYRPVSHGTMTAAGIDLPVVFMEKAG